MPGRAIKARLDITALGAVNDCTVYGLYPMVQLRNGMVERLCKRCTAEMMHSLLCTKERMDSTLRLDRDRD